MLSRRLALLIEAIYIYIYIYIYNATLQVLTAVLLEFKYCVNVTSVDW